MRSRFPFFRVLVVLFVIAACVVSIRFLPVPEYHLLYSAGLAVLIIVIPLFILRRLFYSAADYEEKSTRNRMEEPAGLESRPETITQIFPEEGPENGDEDSIQNFISNISKDLQEKTKIIPVMNNQLKEVIEMTDEAAMKLSSSFLNINKQAKNQVQEASEVFGIMAQSEDEDSGNLLLELRGVLNKLLDDFHTITQYSRKNQGAVESVLSDMNTIQGIVSKIESITENSKVLAINAAIEAARAGEHGSGFAVVATEFRKLSDSSAHAHQEIQAIIEQITHNAQNIVEEMNRSMESGENIINQADDLFKGTLNKIDHTLTSTRDQLRVLSQHAETLAKDISAIVVSIQFQDITRQRIEHVMEPLQEFREELIKIANDLSDNNFEKYSSVRDHSEWLKDKYTMVREKEILEETYKTDNKEEE